MGIVIIARNYRTYIGPQSSIVRHDPSLYLQDIHLVPKLIEDNRGRESELLQHLHDVYVHSNSGEA